MVLFIVHATPFFEISFLERVTARNPKGFPPTNPFRHWKHVVTMIFKEKQGDNASSVTCLYAQFVKGAFSARGPDSSVDGVPVVYCTYDIHMEEEVQVKVQVEEEIGETHGTEQGEEQRENKRSSRTHG